MAVNLRERAYQHIRRKLLVGELGAGQRLSEVSLAKEIGVSRTPVREAVSQLASEGLLERDPSLGALVKQVSRAELVELLNLRVLLEPYAARRAALRADEEHLRQLGEAMQRLREISRALRDGGLEAWQGELGRELTLADIIFHMIVLSAAGSPRLARVIDDLHVVTTRYRPPTLRSLPNLASVLLEHWRIYAAIRRGDARAAHAAMRIHNVHGRRKSVRAFDQQQRESDHGAPRVTDWSALLGNIAPRGASGNAAPSSVVRP